VENEDKVEEYLDQIIPSIGYVVMYFNSLEKSLDSIICEIFTDRTDYTGLIVLHKLNYATKVDLFKRFSDGFHEMDEFLISGYDDLIRNLKESGRLRNLVVHADWENTVDDGYTYVKLKITKGNLEQEYAQFTDESLSKILDLIVQTQEDLYVYWEKRNDRLYNRTPADNNR